MAVINSAVELKYKIWISESALGLAGLSLKQKNSALPYAGNNTYHCDTGPLLCYKMLGYS